jgi:hypothetical protein
MIKSQIIAMVLMVLCLAVFARTEDEVAGITESGTVEGYVSVAGKYAIVNLSNVRDCSATTVTTTEPTTRAVEVFETSINSQRIEGIIDGDEAILRLFGAYRFTLGHAQATHGAVVTGPAPVGVAESIDEAFGKTESIIEIGQMLAQVPDALLEAESDKNHEIAEKAKRLAAYLAASPGTFIVQTKNGTFTAMLSPSEDWKKLVSEHEVAPGK